MSRAPSDDEMITLKDACEIFFGGRVTVATLKAEHARGNLSMSKIGRSYWTTITKLREMETKCLVEAPAPTSGGTKREKAGPSSMDESAAAQASALQKLQERRKLLGITARRSTQSGVARTRS
jgi:hypothetical protein